jgi:hypothetical protein
MDQLLELALRNWFVVIIIIAILSSFRRMRRSGTATGEQANRMPSFGGGPTASTQSDSTTSTYSLPPAQTQSRGSSPFSNPSPFGGSPVIRDSFYIEPDEDEEDESHDDFTQVMRNRAFPKKAMYNNVSRSPIPSTVLKNSSLKQAVLWAEIIGPPRAKRPYKLR